VVKLRNLTHLIKGRIRGPLFLYSSLCTILFTAIFSNSALAEVTTFDCGNSEQAKALSNLIATDKGQQRPVLVCHPTLVKLAEEKAKDMASRGLVSHFLGGSPNSRIRDAGLVLPDYYGDAMSNQVEALAGGYITAEDVWYALQTSTSHRQHLLAEVPFYQEQDQIGVGFYKDYSTPHVEYWAVYLTKLENDTDIAPEDSTIKLVRKSKKFDEIPDKGLGIVTKDGEVILKTKKPD
jgi:uncharacterized protein YkwD